MAYAVTLSSVQGVLFLHKKNYHVVLAFKNIS